MNNKLRLLVQLVLLPGFMVSVAIVDENVFVLLVVVALAVFLVFNWAVHLFQRRLKRIADADPAYGPMDVLDQDVQNSFTRAVISTASALAGVLVLARAAQLIDPVPRWVFLVIIAYVMSASSIPAVDWLVRWRPVWRDLLKRRNR